MAARLRDRIAIGHTCPRAAAQPTFPSHTQTARATSPRRPLLVGGGWRQLPQREEGRPAGVLMGDVFRNSHSLECGGGH